MKILVTAKRVEDPESKIKVKPDGTGIVQEGLKYKINPFDEIAVEESLRLTAKSPGVTDLVQGSTEGRGLGSWRTLLVIGIVLGGLAYTLLADAPDAGSAYSWLDAHLTLAGEAAVLFGAGLLIGAGARTAGGCTSGHGLSGSALLSPASLVSISTIMATAVTTTLILDAVV